jgi:D-alanyl-D-alanine carboxypeptidase (penicillin-binding protein 5/6)
VILGCETTDERFGGARKMLDWGFANFTRYTPKTEEIVLTKVPVLHGEQADVMPVADAAEALLLHRGEEGQIRTEVTLANDVEAPVFKGQVIGTVTLKRGEDVLASYAIRATDEVKRLGFWQAVGWLWREMAGLDS